jgi:DnaK suppressor protein
MNSNQLAHFKKKLEDRAAELRRAAQDLQKRMDEDRYSRVGSEVPDAGDASVADVVTDLNNSTFGRELDELRGTEAALGRIDSGSYGICQRCGRPIDEARLEAFPTALYDLEHQSELERGPAGPRTPTL